MATEYVSDSDAGETTLVETLNEYVTLVVPFAVGLFLIALGYVFDLFGRGVEAGVSAASGIIICVIALVVYGLFWALGRYGH
ncbi:hypothetical protein [Natrononativus amylolyticus]|uniref:hypothetical protein n=1 Tax=Natrononativus amylolyticus TaxID=2963434 RepID=UPI0020CD90C7|nr:hypothetical protein [Natrononativus amylolyticus]